MNDTMIDPGRGPLDLELYPVTAQRCIKAKKRNTERIVWSEFKTKTKILAKIGMQNA